MIFKLPLYAPPNSKIRDKYSSRGRESSALRFFVVGYQQDSSPSNIYGHLDEAAPVPVPVLEPSTVERKLVSPIDPKNHFSLNPEAPVECCEEMGIPEGDMTFWLTGKKDEDNSVTEEFMKLGIPYHVREAREAERRERIQFEEEREKRQRELQAAKRQKTS